MTFSKLGLSDAALCTISEVGYLEPTPIQAKVIPEILAKNDVLGCAQTGTGKTASFMLPMIDRLAMGHSKARMPRALVLEPTRELAMQVAENAEALGKHTKLKLALLIGGQSMVAQEKTLRDQVDILIVTPGRLLDLVGRGKVLLHGVEILVIDEADRMMDMGFMPEVESIVAKLSPKRQTLLFSATMPPEIKRLSSSLLSNPVEITIDPPKNELATIEQCQLQVSTSNKQQKLQQLLTEKAFKSVIVFANRKTEANDIHSFLTKQKFSAGLLHGDLTQTKRSETLEEFKQGKIQILVASDVAARGIDIENLNCVINYDVPTNFENYIHRIGRTGRAGQKGIAITLITEKTQKVWLDFCKKNNNDVQEIKLQKKTPPKQKKPKTAQQNHTISDSKTKEEMSEQSNLPSPATGDIVGFGVNVPAFMQVNFSSKSAP